MKVIGIIINAELHNTTKHWVNMFTAKTRSCSWKNENQWNLIVSHCSDVATVNNKNCVREAVAVKDGQSISVDKTAVFLTWRLAPS